MLGLKDDIPPIGKVSVRLAVIFLCKHGSRFAQRFRVVSRVMRKFDLALAEIYFRGRDTAPWLHFSRQGAKGQGRRYAARLALDAL